MGADGNQRSGHRAKWRVIEEMIENEDLDWDISKYKTAISAQRIEILMGWDAAVRWNLQENYSAKISQFHRSLIVVNREPQ